MFIKYFYKLAYKILRIYWFIFRPKTSGVLCLIECEDKYLLIKNTYGSDKWKLPGGGIENNETYIDAVRREVYEELQIELPEVTLLTSKVSKEEYKIDTVYIFHTKVNSKEFVFDKKEIKDAKWFSRQGIPEKTNIFVLKALENLKQ